MAFGDRIKARREELALSRPQLADRLGKRSRNLADHRKLSELKTERCLNERSAVVLRRAGRYVTIKQREQPPTKVVDLVVD